MQSRECSQRSPDIPEILEIQICSEICEISGTPEILEILEIPEIPEILKIQETLCRPFKELSLSAPTEGQRRQQKEF